MTTFETPEPISATVDIIFGNIRFEASDRADTVVEVRPVDPSWELDVKAAEQATIEFSNGKLMVKHPKLRTVFSTKWGTVEVLVLLPTGSDVRGETAKGDHLVEGVVGSCRLKTPTGNVTVDHVTGQADVGGNRDIRLGRVDCGAVVKNIGGDSWLGEVAGDLRANSASGHITVDVARARVNAKTSSGDVRVGSLSTGPADLYTATGDVEVGLPVGAVVSLDAHTPAGRVRNHLEASGPYERTVKVRARTHGGDVIVRRA